MQTEQEQLIPAESDLRAIAEARIGFDDVEAKGFDFGQMLRGLSHYGLTIPKNSPDTQLRAAKMMMDLFAEQDRLTQEAVQRHG